MLKSLNKISRHTHFFHTDVLKSNLSSAKCDYSSDINQIKSKYDVVIIGAGHNGLVAANYLAKYSKKRISICVLESRVSNSFLLFF